MSSTAGVGTKLNVAERLGDHSGIGIDLVAMNVNDVVVYGAQPLFFLDYIAMGKMAPARLRELVTGIAKGCKASGCERGCDGDHAVGHRRGWLARG